MKALHPFAVLLHYEQLSLIDPEHGLLLEEPALAYKGPKGWIFGPAADEHAERLHLFASPHFPLAEYFEWCIGRFYPLKRLQLVLLSAEPTPPLTASLWEQLFAGMGLKAPLQLGSPLHALGAALKQGLLVYLADGVAQVAVCRRGQLAEISQAGYGYFLTRALRQHVLLSYRLQIDVPTAEQAWLRLGGSEHQLTIEGTDPKGSSRRQLLIAEELKPALADAFEPLLREIAYQATLHPGLPIQLFGPHAHWLAGPLSQALGQTLAPAPDADRILVMSIQQYLQQQARGMR